MTSAAACGRLSEETSDVATAYAVLCDTYEVDAENAARRDLGAFIQELMEKGLLTTP